MQTVLLATDGSPSALKARELGIELAAALHASLRVVSVWRVPAYEYAYVPVTMTPELARAERERAENAIEEALSAARLAGVEATSDLRQGDAGQEICDAAGESGAELVVLGAHGWGAVKRLLFGSVSNAVLHHAPCPVLVARGDPVQEDGDEHRAVSTSSMH